MKPYIYIIYATLLTTIILSCGNSDTKDTGSSKESVVIDNRILITKEQFDQNGMKLGTMEEKSFPTIVKTTGIIDVPPQNKAVVSAIAGGFIKNTPLLIGDKVKIGQTLLTIENPDFIRMQQEYLEIKEQLTYLKSEYERQKMLIAEKITSQKKFLKSESDYKTAQTKYNGLRKQLSMLNISPSNVEKGMVTSIATIFSPISGSITKMNITKGMYVSPATEMLEIIDNEHIHLELSVFEKDIMRIQKGQVIEFTIPEASTETYEAKIYLVGSSIDESRTIRVHGHLNKDSKENFLTGMFVNANIITESSISKALPETAIVEVEGKHYLLQLDERNDKGYFFKKLEVKQLSNYEGFISVDNIHQFKTTDKFLVKGAFSLIF